MNEYYVLALYASSAGALVTWAWCERTLIAVTVAAGIVLAESAATCALLVLGR